jgi:succinate dehydrogenase/fumarate reductase flavoprotein subunit
MAGADFTLDGLSLSRMGFPGEPKDTKEKFFNDIVTQGFYLNNQKLMEQYIRSAPARLKELLDWGMKVDSSEQRAIFTAGLGLVDAIYRRAKACGVDFLEDVMVLDLVTQGGKVVGALGLDIPTGEFIHFRAKAAVIATGGWHKAFWPNTGMRDLSGEGIAMAHRAGAEIGNMEFITFCCNILLWPPLWRGSLATYILSLRIDAELTNSAGEVFLKKYDPFVVKWGTYMEWNKSFVSFASTREIRDGKGSPHGGIYFGLGSTPYETFERIALPIPTQIQSSGSIKCPKYSRKESRLKSDRWLNTSTAALSSTKNSRLRSKGSTLPESVASGLSGPIGSARPSPRCSSTGRMQGKTPEST